MNALQIHTVSHRKHKWVKKIHELHTSHEYKQLKNDEPRKGSVNRVGERINPANTLTTNFINILRTICKFHKTKTLNTIFEEAKTCLSQASSSPIFQCVCVSFSFSIALSIQQSWASFLFRFIYILRISVYPQVKLLNISWCKRNAFEQRYSRAYHGWFGTMLHRKFHLYDIIFKLIFNTFHL